MLFEEDDVIDTSIDANINTDSDINANADSNYVDNKDINLRGLSLRSKGFKIKNKNTFK